MKKLFLMIALICLSCLAVFADEAPPKPVPTVKKAEPKSIESTLVIRLQRDAKEAKLIIPKSQLKQLRAELEQLDTETDDTTGDIGNHGSTIVGGIFLSLGFIFGGVWFFRSPSGDHKKSKAVVGLIIVFLSAATGTILLANAGPPIESQSITGKMFSPAVHFYKYGTGKIKLETSDTAKTVELIVPDFQETKKTKEEE